MRWEVVEDREALVRRAAEHLLEPLLASVPLLLGMGAEPPTADVLRFVFERIQRQGLSPREFHAFSLYERPGLSPWELMRACPWLGSSNFPDLQATALLSRQPELHLEEALALECHAYEESLARRGSLTLALVVLGPEGFLALNGPGTPFTSRTRALGRGAPSITMGIGTILESDSILVLGQGLEVATAAARLQNDSPTEAFPISALKNHPDTILLLDSLAASKLRIPSKDYLEK